MQKHFLGLSLLILVLDLLSKYWISAHFSLGESQDILPFFKLTLVHNYGAAFGFLSEHSGWQRWFFAVVAFLVSTILVVWILRLRAHEKLLAISLASILGGALGNFSDRLYLGYVVDFLDFHIYQWHWPAFNIADMAISIGTVLLLIDAWLQYKAEHKEKAGT